MDQLLHAVVSDGITLRIGPGVEFATDIWQQGLVVLPQGGVCDLLNGIPVCKRFDILSRAGARITQMVTRRIAA